MNRTPTRELQASMPKDPLCVGYFCTAKNILTSLLFVGSFGCLSGAPAPGSAASSAAAPSAGADCVSVTPNASYDNGIQNIARLGTASQSSTGHWNWDATPDLAIDGNKDGDYWKHSVAHTQADAEGPWWQVDLGKEYPLSKVVIWNRTDGGWGSRLTNFRLWVSKADGTTSFETVLCAGGRSFSPALTITLPQNVRGQAVHVRLNGSNYLQLAEVEVFTASVGSTPSAQ